MTAGTVFYPKGADSAEERLQYYASQFPLVEVDSTYYALPFPKMAELWRDRTPPDFVFDVKAHALMTGQPTETKRLPKTIREELPGRARRQVAHLRARPADGVARCRVADVHRRPRSAARSRASWARSCCSTRSGSSPSARAANRSWRRAIGWAISSSPSSCATASWFNEKNLDRTMRFLTDNKLPFVMVDEPQGFKSSVPPLVAVTSPDLAIMRFHGRNAARPGRPRASPRPSASATCTTAKSWPMGAAPA